MAEVKWIKIVTDIFDDEKMLLIESMPEADGIIVIWFKLLCLAGKNNNGGVFLLGDRIAYTDEMLATIFRRKKSTVQLALKTFEQFGMIEIIDNIITIPNWNKHQSLDSYEKRKERDKIYQAQRRQEQKSLINKKSTDASTDESTDCSSDVGFSDKIRLDKIRLDKINYQQIADMYNEICISFPKCTKLSDLRKKSIKARFNQGYTIEDFKKAFNYAQQSNFLKGNSTKWANFDWIIKDSNMAKVLDGNYDERNDKNAGTSGVNQDDITIWNSGIYEGII